MRTTHRTVRAVVSALAAVAVALTIVVPAAAAAPHSVTIVAHMSKQGTGIFEAGGPAVEAGLVCADGTVLGIRDVFGGYQSGHKVQVLSTVELTCTDGSGTFVITRQIHVVFGGDEPFGWVVRGGTGSYAGLQGSGSGVTSENTDVSNVNTYEGFVVAR